MTPPPVQQIPQEAIDAAAEMLARTHDTRMDALLDHEAVIMRSQAEFILRAALPAIRSSLAPQQQPVVGEVSPEEREAEAQRMCEWCDKRLPRSWYPKWDMNAHLMPDGAYFPCAASHLLGRNLNP